MKTRFLIFLAAFAVVAGSVHAQTGSVYQLSTHVLDISSGKPAQGVVVSLYKYDAQSAEWSFVDKAVTGEDGRIGEFLPYGEDNPGAYKLRFETEDYFRKRSQDSIYPYIEVAFYISDGGHYHIPITASANGYSTYRGS